MDENTVKYAVDRLTAVKTEDMELAMEVVLKHPVNMATTIIAKEAYKGVGVADEVYYKTVISGLAILLASGFIQLKTLSD